MPTDTSPEQPNLLSQEPPQAPEDTQPRPVVTLPDEDTQPQVIAPRAGCADRLMITGVWLAMIGIFVAAVALAGVAGWRDGGVAKRQTQAATLITAVAHQATLARADLDGGRYELALARCAHISTLQPLNPGARACLSTAQAALSATATFTRTPVTPTPTRTPTATLPAPATPGAASSAEELYAQAQTAFRNEDYEAAMKWLEALRGLPADSTRRKEVEDLLVQTYLALADQYRFDGRYGEMVVVIRKALKIRPLPGTDWEFTAYAAELYLSARTYLDAGNVAEASKVFETLMSQAPAFSSDTKSLACQAFAAAGNRAAMTKYNCP